MLCKTSGNCEGFHKFQWVEANGVVLLVVSVQDLAVDSERNA